MCISIGNFDSIFFSRSYALFELRHLDKMKDTTKTACQHNFFDTAQQNFMKRCSYEGHNVYICIYTWNFDAISFLGITPFFNLEICLKWKILLKTVCQLNSSEAPQQNFVYFVVMKDIPCRCAYPQEILIQFFFWE